MASVHCDIEEVELENDNGRMIDGVRATCSRCDHQTEAFGTSGASIRRCLVMMREECELGQENYYTADDDQC